jgi:hypothetical protein
MNKAIILLMAGITLAIAPLHSSAQQAASVEKQSPNSNYTPAFVGQTRIGAVVTKSDYEGKVLTNNLKRPWGIASFA